MKKVIYSTGSPSSTERRMHMACVSCCVPKISSKVMKVCMGS